MKSKKNLFCLLTILMTNVVSAQIASDDNSIRIKMRIIFIDSSASCLKQSYNSHFGRNERYFLVLSENKSNRIDSIYEKYIVIRVYERDFKSFDFGGSFFYISPNMRKELIISKDSKIIGNRCEPLLNEKKRYLFEWHP